MKLKKSVIFLILITISFSSMAIIKPMKKTTMHQNIHVEGLGKECDDPKNKGRATADVAGESFAKLTLELDAISTVSYDQACRVFYKTFLALLKSKKRVIKYKTIRREMIRDYRPLDPQGACIERLDMAVQNVRLTLEKNKLTPEKCEELRKMFKTAKEPTGDLTVPQMAEAIRARVTDPIEIYPAIAIICLGYDEKGNPLSAQPPAKPTTKEKVPPKTTPLPPTKEEEKVSSVSAPCQPTVDFFKRGKISLTKRKDLRPLLGDKSREEAELIIGCAEKVVAALQAENKPPQPQLATPPQQTPESLPPKQLAGGVPPVTQNATTDPQKLTDTIKLTGIAKDATSGSEESVGDIDEDEGKSKGKTTHVAGGGSSSGSSSSARSDFPETAKPRVERPNMGFVFRPLPPSDSTPFFTPPVFSTGRIN